MRFSLAATLLALMFLFVLKSQASNCDAILNGQPPPADRRTQSKDIQYGFNPFDAPFKYDPSGKIRIDTIKSSTKVLTKSADKQVVEFTTPYNVRVRAVSTTDSSFSRVVQYYSGDEKSMGTVPTFTVNMQGRNQSCEIRSIVNVDHKLYDQFTCEKIIPLIRNYSQDKFDKCIDVVRQSLDIAKAHDDEQKKLGKPTILFNTADADFNNSAEFQIFNFISDCRLYKQRLAAPTSRPSVDSNRSGSAR